eukprot:36923-Ditylum_brightwellii.AAC.1
MKKENTTVYSQGGCNRLDMNCPNDIVEYQYYMGAVDHGDQHCVMGTSFSNVACFKKWYKKLELGVTYFSMLQSFSEYYATSAEEMMLCVDKYKAVAPIE